MTILCAWCKEYLGEKEPLADHRVTHSMCLKCKQTMRLEAQRLKPDYALSERGEDR